MNGVIVLGEAGFNYGRHAIQVLVQFKAITIRKISKTYKRILFTIKYQCLIEGLIVKSFQI